MTVKPTAVTKKEKLPYPKKGKANPLDKYIGERLLVLRKAAGITRKHIAEKTGISFQQLQKYEAGYDRVSASRLYVIASILNLPLETFFPVTKQKTLTELPLYLENDFLQQTLDYLRAMPDKQDLVRSFEDILVLRKRHLLKK